jgi:hypothetical protein
MENEKELTIEDIQKELGNTLKFFNQLTQQLVWRYNQFQKTCSEQESEMRKRIRDSIEWRREILERKRGDIFSKYEKQEEKITAEVNYLVKKLTELTKVIDRKRPTAIQQAKIDAKIDDED